MSDESGLQELCECPLCKHKAVLDTWPCGRTVFYRVACPTCGFKTGLNETKESAIHAWNCRKGQITRAIKNCPLCGGPPEIVDVDGIENGIDASYTAIKCDDCGCQTRLCDTENEAINLWNAEWEK